ncbi:DUF2752 domain-containing protein [Cellulomonas composti]|uniref:Membrane protein n=1 Tax=Cellulomonas composti TaxID=266130 RepID=A0A511J651_9CELL|nr:DUF2752 domain-containing protein [Cellulomonas composti]GEL93464.1 membrane protein [Cellulomonas composti]
MSATRAGSAPEAEVHGPVTSRSPAWRTPAAIGVAVGAAALVVALHDPHQQGSYGFCPMLALTGWWCPACGGLRATHDLLHGDVAGAWGMNALWVVLAPVLVVLWVVWLVRALRGRPGPALRPWAWWGLLVLVVAFGVLRNVPALAPWLAP